MKKNKGILIIVLILVVVAAGLFFTDTYSTLKKSESDFGVVDTASVTKIFIADRNSHEVTLVKNENGSWLVNGAAAQTEKVAAFLKTLTDLKVRNPVPLAARNNVITRMATLAKKVEIYQVQPRINLFNAIRLFPREKLVKTYYVGDVTPDNQGTFMLMEGAESPFVVHIPGFRGFIAARYSALDYEWRDYTVFKAGIGEISKVKLEFPSEPLQSYLVEVSPDKDVKLTSLFNNEVLPAFDTIRVLNFLSSFQDIRFEALLNQQIEQHVIDSVLASQPRTILTLTTTDNRVNEVKIYYKQGFAALYMEDGAALEPFDLDRAYALVNDGKDFVLIQYFVFDKVTRSLAYLRGREE